MSVLEAARAATATAQAKVDEAKVLSAAAVKELTDARNEERRLSMEKAKIDRAAEVAEDRKNYPVTFGQDYRWMGIDDSHDGLDLYIQENTNFHGVVELTREEAVALRDYLNTRYQD